MSVTEFDKKALSYDKEFTHSYVGRIQRERIHELLYDIFDSNEPTDILEINCGTGADLPLLAKYGDVLATDASEQMLQLAQAKHGEAHIEFQRWDLNLPAPFTFQFDYIFSNFGGLNCISPQRMKELDGVFTSLLKPGGQMIFTLMHNWSYVEFCYFLMRLNFKKAWRRMKGQSTFGELDIYYYSKRQLEAFFPNFTIVQSKPVGVILAGEYMNRIGQFFGLRERNTRWLFPLYGADHVVYVLKRK